MDILTIGGLLVEIMRKETDKPFDASADLVGPFPSGDVGIFVDVAARMGGSAGVIGAIGDDGFGRCLMNRFAADGVDTSMVEVRKGATTGTAFVAYFHDGSRNFIYHWRHAAAGMIDPGMISAEKVKDVKWAHITGVSISVNEQCKQAIYKLLECLPKTAKVSFDPNIRPEVLSVEEIREMCAPVVKRADIFFPSLSEAMLFTNAKTDDEGCKRIAAEGKLVVLKRGARGCRIYDGDRVLDVPAFTVEEVDPTGAGDSFCAAFITALNDGLDLYAAGEFANAVGALAVTQKGPMEGAKDKREVQHFILAQRKGV